MSSRRQGRYNWKLIDDVIAAWKPRGAAVAMRVMTCNAHSSGYYTSPKWLVRRRLQEPRVPAWRR